MTVLLLVSCGKKQQTPAELQKAEAERIDEQFALDYKFECKDVRMDGSGYMQRCENREAVCYVWHGHKKGGPSCKFKK